VRTRRPHSRRRTLLPLLFLAGALSLGTTAVAAIQAPPRTIPDGTFVPVTIDAQRHLGRRAGAQVAWLSASEAPPIADPWLLSEPPAAERARPSLPATTPIALARPSTPKHSISGRASWFCDAGTSPCSASHPDTSGFDAYAAAGPRLRAAIGPDWRGSIVLVDGIRVKLIDWCQCYQGEPSEKLLDLYHDVYLRTGSSVTIRW
jgi:hypothetical protein